MSLSLVYAGVCCAALSSAQPFVRIGVRHDAESGSAGKGRTARWHALV